MCDLVWVDEKPNSMIMLNDLGLIPVVRTFLPKRVFMMALGKFGLLMLSIVVLVLSLKWIYASLHESETPFYQEANKQGSFAFRHYPTLILASTDVHDAQMGALKTGFRTVAAYIFGGNQDQLKIAMTRPVLQIGHAMKWQIAFIMPQKFTLSELPLPKNQMVKLSTLAAADYVVCRFSGRIRQKNLQDHAQQLNNFLQKKGCHTEGEPIFAFYNPPWTLPIFRRNEVWLKLSKPCI